MLNGACNGLLSLLSSELRQTFDEELCQILSSSGAGQNSMLLLWCFGIVLLAERPEEAENAQRSRSLLGNQTRKTVDERQWSTKCGRKLFGSPTKTINLVYLSVIWASKGDVDVPDAEAIEAIRIATRVMQFVDKEVRESWPTTNKLAKSTFYRLPGKILRQGIDPEVQFEVGSDPVFLPRTINDSKPGTVLLCYNSW